MPTFSYHELRRIELATSVHDTDALPKVPGAGTIVERDGTRVQVMHNGVVVEEGCYYGAWMTEIIRRLGGHHEPQEEVAFDAVVKRLRRDVHAPVMVELGAFWAYYALWVKQVMPAARCVLVEPDPARLDVTRRNLALNRVEAEVVEAAVGAVDRRAVPFICESDGVTRDVDMVSLDGLIDRLALGRVDLVLCDTQGAELDTLRGAARALASRDVRFLVLSTHHHEISGDPLIHQRCLELLAACGAHIVAEHTVHESASGDGLIVASLDPADRDLVVTVSRVRAQDSLFGGLEADLAAAFAERDEARAELRRTRSG